MYYNICNLTSLALNVDLLSCLVVILANTPMESNGQGWVRMLFSHVCLGQVCEIYVCEIYVCEIYVCEIYVCEICV